LTRFSINPTLIHSTLASLQSNAEWIKGVG